MQGTASSPFAARGAAPAPLLTLLAVLLAVAPAACDKGDEAGSKAPAAAPTGDRYEQHADELLAVLGSGNRTRMVGISGPALQADFGEEAFHDISEIVRWLGSVKGKEMTKDEAVQGGRHRVYLVSFDKGKVELDVTVENDMILGFRFSGDDWIRAERGAIAEKYREFKVYDFRYTTEKGEPNPDAPTYHTKRVDWQIYVGGIEARQGEHHLTVEKVCKDAEGNIVFNEPTTYDVRFDANAEGIPTGHVDGWIEVPKPGKYSLEIKLKDNYAYTELEHIVEFEVDRIE